MKFSRHLLGVFIFAIFFTLAPVSTEATGLQVSEIVSQINRERSSRGLSTLKFNNALTQAAQARSAVLAQAGQIFHVSAPTGVQWTELSQAGYDYTLAGENLALGIESDAELISRWMLSPTHRENILEAEFEDIGIGITVGNYQGRLMSYVVSYYGKKKTGAVTATVAQAAPVSSVAVSSPKGVSKSAPTSQKTLKPSPTSSSPVLSRQYTIETMPEAAPDISSAPAQAPSGERVRVIDQIIAFFSSYVRTFWLHADRT